MRIWWNSLAMDSDLVNLSCWLEARPIASHGLKFVFILQQSDFSPLKTWGQSLYTWKSAWKEMKCQGVENAWKSYRLARMWSLPKWVPRREVLQELGEDKAGGSWHLEITFSLGQKQGEEKELNREWRIGEWVHEESSPWYGKFTLSIPEGRTEGSLGRFGFRVPD